MLPAERPTYTQYQFEQTFQRYCPRDRKRRPRSKRCLPPPPQCSKHRAKNFLFERVPALQLLCSYQWKKWLLWDMIAGLSVGVIHIPQGMGFALVTAVPPALGLYSSLFPPLLYFLFGTSRHISVGTMAVISIMIGSVVNREVAGMHWANANANVTHSVNATDYASDNAIDHNLELEAFKVDIATSVTLLMGAFMVLLSLLRLGRIGSMMSMTFIGGFLTGSACVIITAQVPILLGMKLPPILGLFRVPLTWYAVFSHLLESNIAEVVISLTSIAILVIIKMVVNEQCKEKFKIPIPIELLVMILATLISHYTNLHDTYGVKIVGAIPSGLPTPRVPSMQNARSYALDAFMLAIVSFTLSISMAKLLSQKHQYAIDDNQEMFAYGMSYGLSAFFGCFGGAQAPPRTLIHESCGGKTQMAALFSSVLVLCVCLFMGSLVESVPNSVLSSIIVVALLPLFKECFKLKNYWKVNKYDLLVWLVTCFLVSILDITIGLSIGIGLSLLTVVIDAFLKHGVTLRHHPQAGEIYRPPSAYVAFQQQARSPAPIRIFSFPAPLFYANVDRFREQLFAKTEFDPVLYSRSLGEVIANIDAVQKEDAKNIVLEGVRDAVQSACRRHVRRDTTKDVTAVILDCSAITYADMAGLQMLATLRSQYKAARVTFALAGCSVDLLDKLRNCGYLQAHGLSADDHLYPTIHDAFIMLQTPPADANPNALYTV